MLHAASAAAVSRLGQPALARPAPLLLLLNDISALLLLAGAVVCTAAVCSRNVRMHPS
jgi:hypothetical protein